MADKQADDSILIKVRNLSLSYSGKPALNSINMDIQRNKVMAFIGPSGCGKSTLLRCFNRMNDMIEGVQVTGSIDFDDVDILAPNVDVAVLRRDIGMVFQRPNPFPKTIYDNVAFGLRLMGMKSSSELDDRVQWALKGAALWDEVEDRLHSSALELSGGQQQRLVIARAIAMEPQVLLLDEPASALDPLSSLRIEQLVAELKQNYTVVIVTHNMQQASRVSDQTAMMYLGDLIEVGDTEQIFTNPQTKRTDDYISGRYG